MIKKLSIVFLALSLFACSEANKPEANKPGSNKPEANNTETTAAVPAPAAGEKFAEGTHYTVIKTPIAIDSDKIVVTEFFWYGCPHCQHFEPFLEAWDKKKPADVILNRSPAVWRDSMKLHAKLYFLAQTLPNKDFVHSALFTEIMALREEENMDVQNQKLAQFLAKFGVSEEDYNNKVQSSDIDAKMQSAVELMQKAGVAGTPTMMVNGKYLVNNEHVSSMEQILEIADFLIEKERATPIKAQ